MKIVATFQTRLQHVSNTLTTRRLSILGMIFFLFSASAIPLRDCLRTHKVFTKDQCFYLNYHVFSIKSYVVGVY